MIHHERILGALGIFALLVGFVIFIFTCYQLSLVYYGMTANEAFKWEDMEDIVMAGELWVFEKDIEEESKRKKKKNKNKDTWEVRGKTTAIYYMQSAKQRQNRSLEGESEVNRENSETNEENSEISEENSRKIGQQVKSMSELHNLYDQGFWNNFKEIIFPPSL